jgi:RNA polymerase sigma-70 factor (ECF subfamily)
MTIYQHDFRLVPDEPPDIREFEAFWERVHGRLCRLVARRYDAADADEIVQETMLRCYENWSRLDPERDPWPWLTVVARRIATDHARARTRRAELEAAAVPPLVDPSRPDEEVCARELSGTVQQALLAMGDSDRTLLSLRYLDEMPTAEIASLTGRTDTAVRQHLFRVRPRFAAILRRLLDGTAGALAPAGCWLRRWRKALAGAVPSAGTLAVCCLSIVTGVTVGAGLGHGHRPRTTGLRPSVAVADRPEIGTVRHVAAATATAPEVGATARRPTGRTGPVVDPPAPPVAVHVNGDPTQNGGDTPHSADIVVSVVPGHDVFVHDAGDSTPGYAQVCELQPVRCPGER